MSVNETQHKRMSDSWRLFANSLAEFLPIVTFLLLSETMGFFVGIKWLIIVAVVCIAFSWYVEKRIPKFGLFASGIIVLFGGLSLFFGNSFFIIVKDTLYNLFFGTVLLVGLFRGTSLLKTFFSDFFLITDRGWVILSRRWMYFFFLLAATNEVTRIFFSEQVWLIYKGIAVVTTWVFGFYQFTLTKKERLPEASPWGLKLKH
jgi:intracellular septation protein